MVVFLLIELSSAAQPVLVGTLCLTEYVPFETRLFTVPPETRLFTTLAESRTFVVPPEPRTFTADCCEC